MIQNVFWLHKLLASIVLDCGSHFVFIMWKILCKCLFINVYLSIAFYPQMNEQSKCVNQDIESYLWLYCNYYQNDWVWHLLMREYADNNNVFLATEMSLFFTNKGFYSQTSFSLNTFTYKSIWECLLAYWAEDITKTMKNDLTYIKKLLKQTQAIITNNVNYHRKDVTYKVSQKVFFNYHNIKIKRLCLKLNDKNIGLYKILQKVEITYWLKLLAFMKIHSVFHIMHLQTAVMNSLLRQINAPLRSVIVDNQNKWVIDEIIDFCHTEINYHLQYWVKWHNYL